MMKLFLKEWRERTSLTQAQVGDLCGTSEQSYNRWERGKRQPGADDLFLIAEAFGCHPGNLFESPEDVDQRAEAIAAAELIMRIPPDSRKHWLEVGRAMALHNIDEYKDKSHHEPERTHARAD